MDRPQTLDIILPCYNPRQDWTHQLSDSLSVIKPMLGADVLSSVIVVNDGSTRGIDGANVAALIRQHPEVKLIEYAKNRGKGHAVRTGVRHSAADLQIYTDIDMPYSEESIKVFYEMLRNGEADVVVATRGASYYSALSPFRRVLSKVLRWLNGRLFRLKIEDTQGGLKGFNAKGRSVFLTTRIDRYLFDLEFIQKASKEGLDLKGVDVMLRPDIVLPAPGPLVLLKEMHNLLLLLLPKTR